MANTPPHQDLQAKFKGQPDWELLKKIIPFAEFMKMYHNYQVDGVFNIPQEGRVLLLVNHSLATYDILLLGYSLLEKLGRLPRGLADSNFYKTKLVAKLMEDLGVFEANPQNAEQILLQDDILVLAPGGTREAIRSSKEKYQIKWDDRKGFARLAVKTQSPVVLAACPAADNLYEVEDSVITKWVYRLWKLPLTFAKGIGNTIFPRPLKLVHYIHKPIFPPTFDGDEPSEEIIEDFHHQVVTEMEDWLKSHVNEIPKKK